MSVQCSPGYGELLEQTEEVPLPLRDLIAENNASALLQ